LKGRAVLQETAGAERHFATCLNYIVNLGFFGHAAGATDLTR